MKIRSTLAFFFFAITLHTYAQRFWHTPNGKIDFYSKTPVKDIEAHSKAAGAIVNSETGQLAFKVPMKSFIFPNSLMQEHFNENYMESEKYPDATFSGKMDPLVNFLKPGTYPVKAKGKLKMHGVEVDREFSGTITINTDKSATLASEIDVLLADHKIERPTVVMVEIAEKVAVKTEFILKPKE